jgi:hypothetical protein
MGNGSEPVLSSAKNGDGEYSAVAERKERILKLRLINAAKRVTLERLRESTVTMSDCMETMARIPAHRPQSICRRGKMALLPKLRSV